MARQSTSARIGVAFVVAAVALAGVHPLAAAQSPHPAVETLRGTVAAPQQVARATALAAGCTPCHQPQVRGIPALDGQTREALRAKLRAFRDGTLSGTVMPQLVRGYTPAELDLVAGWFASGGDAR